MKEWCRRTCKGRVVYNRKLHPFRVSDVRRIAGRVPEILILEWNQDFFVNCLQPEIDRQTSSLESGGGGEFGGGGATRPFGFPFPEPIQWGNGLNGSSSLSDSSSSGSDEYPEQSPELVGILIVKDE